MNTVTKIADVIVPEIFNPYVVERTAEKSRLIQSGIAVPNARLNDLVTRWLNNANALLARLNRR